jgi:Protein of unknown function (DUF2752)
VLPREQSMDDDPVVRRRANWWVRGTLVLIAAGLALVFFVATRVQPYAADGTALKQASHQSLGLPACRFKEMTDLPCPSCGMTTSFALLVRGDVGNSLRANWVGSGLAVFCALLIPWCIASSIRGRYLWVHRVESAMALLVGVFTVLMLSRWGIVLLMRVFE